MQGLKKKRPEAHIGCWGVPGNIQKALSLKFGSKKGKRNSSKGAEGWQTFRVEQPGEAVDWWIECVHLGRRCCRVELF